MAGLLRPPAAKHAGRGAAQPVRPAGACAHPRHPGRPAGHLCGRLAGRGRRRRRCRRADGGNHQPARAVSSIVAAAAHTDYDTGLSLCGGLRPRALLGGAAQGVRAVRIRAARADGPGLPPRDSGRPAVEPAPAGDRPGARGSVREIEEAYAGADRVLGRLSRSRRRRRWSATWRWRWSVRVSCRRIRLRAGAVRHPRIGARVPARRARRSAGRLARTAAHRGAGRPRARQAHPAAEPTTRRLW